MHEFLSTINWRTTGLAIAYLACKIVGGLFPSIEGVCAVLEPIVVASGFATAADSQRVANVVRAVDHILFKQGEDPNHIPPAVVES